PHALEVGIGLDALRDARVRFDRGLAERSERLGVTWRVQGADGHDRGGARHVTTDRAAHAVGDGEQMRTGVAGVLVPRLRTEPDVGACGVTEREPHPAFSWP